MGAFHEIDLWGFVFSLGLGGGFPGGLGGSRFGWNCLLGSHRLLGL